MDGTTADEFEPRLKVRVARSLEDLQKVMVVRSLVYMHEQDCPYEEEYDGNDFAGATHLLAEMGGEPVGTIRLRWFADFAKIERVALRPQARRGQAGQLMVGAALKMIRRKGYRRAMAQAQYGLLEYWCKRHGATHRKERGVFVFSDRAYVEVEWRFDPLAGALSMDSDPLVIDRPEGEWDRPGPLDRSSKRGVSPAQAGVDQALSDSAEPAMETE
ncbi:MAG: GNAT family N-acetyltransferase [Oceanicaulis sp.]